MLTRLLYNQYKTLHRIVFPPRCLVCESFFQIPDDDPAATAGNPDGETVPVTLSLKGRLGRSFSGCLCPSCIRELVPVESPICDCCGWPFKSRIGADHRCGECISEPKNFRIARAPLVYEQILTKVIHCFKYKGKVQLANPLGEILLTAFSLFWPEDGIDIILPVPLHLKRFRQRGFNQAYMLVRNWKKIAGQYPYCQNGFQIERDLLIRPRETAPQAALGRVKRGDNIKKAFDIVDRGRVVDKRILLVDDIYTTGATVNECARLLLGKGARFIDVLTLARAV